MFVARQAKYFKVSASTNRMYWTTGAYSHQSSTPHKQQYDKKFQYYKNLNEAAKNVDSKPPGWDKALPFEKVPGPKPIPLIGNAWRFFPKIGEYSNMDLGNVVEQLQIQYGNVVVLKGIPGRLPLVCLYDIADIEKVYRNEGPWPVKKGNVPLHHYRTVTRKGLFKIPGIGVTQGEEWFKLRSMINPILMQPRNLIQYMGSMNKVADELVDNINHFSTFNPNGEMPETFNRELYKWALESVCLVTTDKHLGCLKRDSDPNSEPQKLLQHVLELFYLMLKLENLPLHVWKYYNIKNWKRFVEVMDFLTEVTLKYINNSLESQDVTEKNTVLANLLKIDKDIAISMTSDLIIAGVHAVDIATVQTLNFAPPCAPSRGEKVQHWMDNNKHRTADVLFGSETGRAIAATLYFLSRFPEKQVELRKEAMELLEHKNSPVTKEVLENAKYLKAVIKESLRISPIISGQIRTTVKDLVIGGYRIPKETDILSFHLFLCRSDQSYPKAKDFLPERWLSETKDEMSHKNTNPFVSLPFGYGPRSCPARRLANLKLEVALLKIVRNFELSWPHEDMTFANDGFYGVARPVKMWVKPLSK